MIWIIGEYAERIDNADELLESFLEGFHDENSQVQLQLLTAIVKLFLKRPSDTQELVQQVSAVLYCIVLYCVIFGQTVPKAALRYTGAGAAGQCCIVLYCIVLYLVKLFLKRPSDTQELVQQVSAVLYCIALCYIWSNCS